MADKTIARQLPEHQQWPQHDLKLHKIQWTSCEDQPFFPFFNNAIINECYLGFPVEEWGGATRQKQVHLMSSPTAAFYARASHSLIQMQHSAWNKLWSNKHMSSSQDQTNQILSLEHSFKPLLILSLFAHSDAAWHSLALINTHPF